MWFIDNIKNGRFIRGGVLFILVISPLPFGSVQSGVFFTLEIIVLLLFILWLIRVWLNSSRHQYPLSPSLLTRKEGGKIEDRGAGQEYKKSSSFFNPLTVVMGLLILLVALQLVPLPPWLMKSVSPMTYRLHNSILPKLTAVEEMTTLSKVWNDAVKGGTERKTDLSQISQELVSQYSKAAEGPEDSQLTIGSGDQILPLLGSAGSPDPEKGNSYTIKPGESWQSLSFNPYLTKLVLYKLLAYGLIFLLVVKNIENYEQARNMVLVIIFAGVFQAFYGLIDLLTGHNHIFFYKKATYQNLATGTFINRNHLAGYLEMIIPLSLAYFLDRLERRQINHGGNWRVKLSSIENTYSKYAFLLFLVVIMAFALVFSQSRMGIIGLSTALAFFGLGLSWRRKSRLPKSIFMAVVAAAILLGILAGLDEVMGRFEKIPDEMASEGARLEVWQDSMKIVKDYPWLGIGAGNYSSMFPRYKSFSTEAFYDHAHNDYVEMLAEVGLAGMAIFLAGMIYYAVIGLRFLRRYRESSKWIMVLGGLAGLLAISLHGLTDFNMQIPSNALLFFALLALVYRIMQFGDERVKVRRHRA